MSEKYSKKISLVTILDVGNTFCFAEFSKFSILASKYPLLVLAMHDNISKCQVRSMSSMDLLDYAANSVGASLSHSPSMPIRTHSSKSSMLKTAKSANTSSCFNFITSAPHKNPNPGQNH